MAINDPRFSIGAVDARIGTAALDQGLRAFMLAVYNHMALGVAITGLLALGVFMLATSGTPIDFLNGVPINEFGKTVLASPLRWVLVGAPLALVLYMQFGADRLSANAARGMFYIYAALLGVSLSTLLFVYTGASVARVFFISSASFAALSLYGYTTKRDLTAIGSFLIMGLVGLLLAMVVNLFWPSGRLTFLITLAGVGIFAGLTAYDTQRLKSNYFDVETEEGANKLAIYGALHLYLDFINMFIMMLRLLGDRR